MRCKIFQENLARTQKIIQHLEDPELLVKSIIEIEDAVCAQLRKLEKMAESFSLCIDTKTAYNVQAVTNSKLGLQLNYNYKYNLKKVTCLPETTASLWYSIRDGFRYFYFYKNCTIKGNFVTYSGSNSTLSFEDFVQKSYKNGRRDFCFEQDDIKILLQIQEHLCKIEEILFSGKFKLPVEGF